MIPFTSEELLPVVMQVINKVRPMLINDGGDIKLLSIKEEKIFVQLIGACNGCSASDQTLKFGIEKQLRIDIHPELLVINIASGNLEEIEKYL